MSRHLRRALTCSRYFNELRVDVKRRFDTAAFSERTGEHGLGCGALPESTSGLVESTSGLAESTSEVVESTSGPAESTNGLEEST